MNQVSDLISDARAPVEASRTGVSSASAGDREPDAAMAKERQKEYLTIGALVLGALSLRLLFLPTGWVLDPDSVYYSWLGKALLSGDFNQGLSTYWPPFYPLLVGISWRLLGDLELAGRIVSVIAGSLVVIPTYLLAREFYGKQAAMISGVLVMFYPPLVILSTRALSEATYGLILMLMIWILWNAVKKASLIRLIGAGLLVGVAYLTKPEGIFYLIIGLIILFSLRSDLDTFRVKQRFVGAIVLIASAGIISFPYLAYLRHTTGVWMISQKANVAIGVAGHIENTLRDDDGTLMDSLYASGKVRVQGESILQKIGSNIPMLISKVTRGIHQFSTKSFPILFPPLLIGLAFLGLFHQSWGTRRWEQELTISLFIGATILGYAVTHLSGRYMVPFLPLLLIWTALGVQTMAGWLNRSTPDSLGARWPALNRPEVASTLLIGVIFLSLLPEVTYPWRNGKWDQPIEQKRAARWIKDNGSPQPVIMATGPWAAFYAEGRHVYIPQADYDSVIAYARRRKVEYLIVDARWIESFNRSFRFLLKDGPVPKDLVAVYRVDEHPDYPLVVYRLRNRDRT